MHGSDLDPADTRVRQARNGDRGAALRHRQSRRRSGLHHHPTRHRDRGSRKHRGSSPPSETGDDCANPGAFGQHFAAPLDALGKACAAAHPADARAQRCPARRIQDPGGRRPAARANRRLSALSPEPDRICHRGRASDRAGRIGCDGLDRRADPNLCAQSARANGRRANAVVIAARNGGLCRACLGTDDPGQICTRQGGRRAVARRKRPRLPQRLFPRRWHRGGEGAADRRLYPRPLAAGPPPRHLVDQERAAARRCPPRLGRARRSVGRHPTHLELEDRRAAELKRRCAVRHLPDLAVAARRNHPPPADPALGRSGLRRRHRVRRSP